MQHAYEALPSASVEVFPGAEFIRQTLAVAEADVRKLIHDPVELCSHAWCSSRRFGSSDFWRGVSRASGPFRPVEFPTSTS